MDKSIITQDELKQYQQAGLFNSVIIKTSREVQIKWVILE